MQNVQRTPERNKEMIVKYKMKLEIEIVQPFEGFDNLKDSHEYASDVCKLIADEATTAGGVAVYDILESSINVK